MLPKIEPTAACRHQPSPSRLDAANATDRAIAGRLRALAYAFAGDSSWLDEVAPVAPPVRHHEGSATAAQPGEALESDGAAGAGG